MLDILGQFFSLIKPHVCYTVVLLYRTEMAFLYLSVYQTPNDLYGESRDFVVDIPRSKGKRKIFPTPLHSVSMSRDGAQDTTH